MIWSRGMQPLNAVFFGGISYLFPLDSATLAGLGIASSSVPYGLRPLDIGDSQGCHPAGLASLRITSEAGADCSSQVTSQVGNAGLVGFAGAMRQSRSRQCPTPLAVRSDSGNIKLLPNKKVPVIEFVLLRDV